MRVVAFDPGDTTGAVAALVKPKAKFIQVIHQGEIEPSDIKGFSSHVAKQGESVGIIEGVVKSGHLSVDKFNQIVVYTRCLVCLEHFNADRIIEIPPSINKNVKGEVPDTIKGNHAKDAYRLILAAIETGKL